MAKMENDEMKNGKLIPRLRFPGFDGEWKNVKIKDVFKITRGKVLAMQQVCDKRISPYIYPVFSSQTMNGGLAGYYNDYLYENAITWTTDGANAGEVNYRAGRFYCTNVCGVLLSAEGYANLCIASILGLVTKSHVSYVGNPKLMNNVMAEIEITVPPSFAEQEKIASCLSELDNLIAAQGQKVDALKEKKKGLMQQLFPQSGETTPRLRFPGFEGEWVEKKLGDLYRKNNVKNDLSFGTDKIISVANMYYKTDANIGDKDYLRTYNIFRLGDIAYEGNKSANYAYGRFVENTIGDGIVSHVFDVYSPISSMHCIDYWKYAINYERIMRPILEKSTIKSTMMTNLIAKDFLKQHILVPSLTEQQKIASCLSSLDDLIAVESAKVEALKDHKKGLMQQLFPQPAK